MKKKACASEENMRVAFINLVPAIVYSLVLAGQFLNGITPGYRIGLGMAFVFVYMLLSLLPYTSFITNTASAVIYIGLVWVLCSKASMMAVAILLKILTAAFIGLLELSIAVNITMKN